MLQATRDSIVSLVTGYAAAYPTIPIYYDNQDIDFNNLGQRFVLLEIKYYGGAQIGMAAAPKTRVAGYVYVTAYARVGTGSRELLGQIDWFASALGYKSAGAVRLQAPEPDSPGPAQGWFMEELKVPFYADQA